MVRCTYQTVMLGDGSTSRLMRASLRSAAEMAVAQSRVTSKPSRLRSSSEGRWAGLRQPKRPPRLGAHLSHGRVLARVH
jgi:hypothetical protein